MFGSQAQKATGQRQTQTFNAPMLGGTMLGGGNPTNTGQKTLLGQ